MSDFQVRVSDSSAPNVDIPTVTTSDPAQKTLTTEQLMTAMASRDGREIVRDLEALRARNALDRDGEGRYVIKPA